MKNVLLLVHDDEGQEARLQAALDLTRALDGHLSCIDVALFPAMVGDIYSPGIAEAMLLTDEREREGKNKTALEARLAHEDVSWDWTDVTGNFVDGVCDVAMLSDIIVLNRKLDQFPYPDMRDVASRILMHARAPIVAMPDDCKRLDLKRALIAWDGQASAAATLRACVPACRSCSAPRRSRSSWRGTAPRTSNRRLQLNICRVTVCMPPCVSSRMVSMPPIS